MDSLPETPLFKLNDFEIQLLFDNIQLVIQAEHKPTLKNFQIAITPEQVKEQTSYIFSDVEFLYLGLLDAFEHKDPNATVTVSNDVKLTYTSIKAFRDKTRTEQFILQLVEENKNDYNRLSRQFDKLLKKVEQQEERILALEKENSRLKSDAERALLEKLEMMDKVIVPQIKEDCDKRFEIVQKDSIPKIKETVEKTLLNYEKTVHQIIEHLDEKLKSFEQSMSQRLGVIEKGMLLPQAKPPQNSSSDKWEFDPTCGNAVCYQFLRSNQTIEYGAYGGFEAVFGKTALPKNRKSKLSIQINSTANGKIMIGICPSTVKHLKRVYNEKGVHCYFGYKSGRMYNSGVGTSLDTALVPRSIVTITVDPQMKIVSFEHNGRQLYSESISDQDEYYPFIEMHDGGDKVSFI